MRVRRGSCTQEVGAVVEHLAQAAVLGDRDLAGDLMAEQLGLQLLERGAPRRLVERHGQLVATEALEHVVQGLEHGPQRDPGGLADDHGLVGALQRELREWIGQPRPEVEHDHVVEAPEERQQLAGS